MALTSKNKMKRRAKDTAEGTSQKKKTKMQNGEFICHFCKKLGHMKRQCPKIVCIAGLLYYHYDFCFVQPFSLSICRSNRGSCLCLIWLYKIALKLMHYVVASLHLKALDYFNFFLVFLLMLYMQKTGLCVSCYLAVILTLYKHQFCVTGPFKYRCYDEE